MHKIIWALGLTIVSSSLTDPAFSQFSDDFSDGDFARSPEWHGTDSDFGVAAGTLALQAPPEAGLSYLSTPSAAVNDAAWEFTVRMDFNPSDANFARAYLVSDACDVTNPLLGYFVLVGGRHDEVSLYRQDGEAAVKLIDGADGRLDVPSVAVRIRVTRSRDGNWVLYSGDPLEEPRLEGTASDLTYTASSCFALYCRYTSTRADGFRFDDIAVTGDPGGSGQQEEAAYKDVIITEILSDPLPSAGLPDVEFVEVFNRTGGPVSLSGWTISDETTAAKLPPIQLPSQEYAVIAASGDAGFFESVRVAAVTGMPTLNNTADAVVLRTASGTTIDSVRYSNTWYRDPQKREGGWTLELIDPSNPCGEEDNWTESEAPGGGTPGMVNSVFAEKPDRTGPHIVAVTAIDERTVRIDYNEKLSGEAVPVGDVIVNPHVEVASVIVGTALRSLAITFGGTLVPGQLYTVSVRNIRDCNHNSAPEAPMPFAVPQPADSLDVIINEILFNPKPGGVDFVEIYNRSRKYINLKGWSTTTHTNGIPEDFQVITETDLLLPPGGFAAITPDVDVLLNQYPAVTPEILLEARLIPLPDDVGSLGLADAARGVVDAMTYNDDMHSIFITAADGVSLERLSADAASDDPDNWRSASTHAGGATPGMKNSATAAYPANVPLKAVTVDPPVFMPVYGSPNFTLIRYRFDKAGYVANARIMDRQGRCIRSIANNDLLGTDGFFRWDGDRDDGSRARIGYYWLWFEVFSPSGDIHTFRERVVVAGDF